MYGFSAVITTHYLSMKHFKELLSEGTLNYLKHFIR